MWLSIKYHSKVNSGRSGHFRIAFQLRKLQTRIGTAQILSRDLSLHNIAKALAVLALQFTHHGLLRKLTYHLQVRICLPYLVYLISPVFSTCEPYYYSITDLKVFNVWMIEPHTNRACALTSFLYDVHDDEQVNAKEGRVES